MQGFWLAPFVQLNHSFRALRVLSSLKAPSFLNVSSIAVASEHPFCTVLLFVRCFAWHNYLRTSVRKGYVVFSHTDSPRHSGFYVIRKPKTFLHNNPVDPLCYFGVTAPRHAIIAVRSSLPSRIVVDTRLEC